MEALNIEFVTYSYTLINKYVVFGDEQYAFVLAHYSIKVTFFLFIIYCDDMDPHEARVGS